MGKYQKEWLEPTYHRYPCIKIRMGFCVFEEWLPKGPNLQFVAHEGKEICTAKKTLKEYQMEKDVIFHVPKRI